MRHKASSVDGRRLLILLYRLARECLELIALRFLEVVAGEEY